MTGTGFAKTYADLWAAGTYGQSPDEASSQQATPLLEALIERLRRRASRIDRTPHIFEGGAGSGDHAILLTRAGFLVTANEYNGIAIARIQQKKASLPEPSKLKVVQGDVLDCIRIQEERSLSGFYANSLVHTFSPEQRRTLYHEINRAEDLNGIIAVSFKADGDAVQSVQSTANGARRTEAGSIIVDEYGIERLFVSDPRPLIRELSIAGYKTTCICSWSVADYIAVKGYNRGTRRFIGLLAEKEG